MPSYSRGTRIVLYANYLNSDSSPINSGISNVKLNFYKRDSTGDRVYMVQSGTMTQDVDSPNRFFYIYNIPATAEITSYTAEYNAIKNGTPVQGTDTISITAVCAATGVYIGSVEVSGTIVDVGGTGIAGAAVNASDADGLRVLTSTSTEANGVYTLYLDPGDFAITASKSGYVSNSALYTVPSGITTFYFGDLTLAGGSATTLNISDTYKYINPNNGQQLPLENLKVSLYIKTASATLVQPLATTRTDANGTFTLAANPGDYVLRVQGNGPNDTVYNTAWDIEISDAYANDTPTNFRYKETSRYNFL